eukprot:SAG11_NODE_4885_length_1733_cov_3.708078_1_plen_262_part_10
MALMEAELTALRAQLVAGGSGGSGGGAVGDTVDSSSDQEKTDRGSFSNRIQGFDKMSRFSHDKSLAGGMDIHEFCDVAGPKILKDIQPNRRCNWFMDFFADDEQRILRELEAEHFDKTGEHYSFEELVAVACWRFANPDSVEKLTNKFHARRQKKGETVRSLLIDLERMRKVLERAGQPISDGLYRMQLKAAVRPTIKAATLKLLDAEGRQHQHWTNEYFEKILIANDDTSVSAEIDLTYAEEDSSSDSSSKGKGKGKGKGK